MFSNFHSSVSLSVYLYCSALTVKFICHAYSQENHNCTKHQEETSTNDQVSIYHQSCQVFMQFHLSYCHSYFSFHKQMDFRFHKLLCICNFLQTPEDTAPISQRFFPGSLGPIIMTINRLECMTCINFLLSTHHGLCFCLGN